MKAILILKCEGRQLEEIKLCSGTENIILDLEATKNTSGYISLIKYLDAVPKLFYSPCFKYNIIFNTIYKIYEMGYFSDKKYQIISEFYNLHKKCGIILECRPKEK